MNAKRTKLNLPDGFVWPDYESGSIANIPGTVAAILKAPFQGLPPLRQELWQPLSGGAKRVVVLVLDALGWNLLAQEQEQLQGVLAKAAVAAQITSVFPSTTTAALSTLWTGAAPAQHGLLGFRLFLPHYATTAQMIRFTPAFGYYPDALVAAGLQPQTFLHTPGFAEQLASAGVPTYVFKGRDIVDSALSKMHDRGVKEEIGISGAADLFVRLRLLLEETAGAALYVYGYLGIIDKLSHIYGWQHPSVAAEVRALMWQFERELLGALTAAARRDTVVFVMADHGQTITTPQQHIYLKDHPALGEMLFMPPTGGKRAAYLYGKHGRREAILNYLHKNLGQALVAIDAGEALANGLFGPQPHASVAPERIGDVVAVAQQKHALFASLDSQKSTEIVGGHGGLTEAEMLVPWLGFRLDE